MRIRDREEVLQEPLLKCKGKWTILDILSNVSLGNTNVPLVEATMREEFDAPLCLAQFADADKQRRTAMLEF